MSRNPNKSNEEEEEEEEEEGDDDDDCFHDSVDRIASSCSCSTSASNSDSEHDRPDSPHAKPFPVPKFPMAVSKFDIWISQPASVSERRSRLLREMGLSQDPALSRSRPASAAVSSQQLVRLQDQGDASSIGRSKADGRDGHAHADSHISSSSSLLSVAASSFSSSSFVNRKNRDCDLTSSFSDPVCTSNGSSAVRSVSPNKPPTGKSCRRIDESRGDSMSSNGVIACISLSNAGNGGGAVDEPDGVDQVCTIKNLDTGKEFVVNEIREDGTWNKLKEVGTGRQLTLEEFELCVGHSPIVQELMRRQNVEDGNNDNVESGANGVASSVLKLKKKGGWFKSIKSVANSVTGHKERRNSDDRDTSSEKGGRRSSSATDDSQEVSFHGPERVRVRQYGKTYKDLTGVYKSQEIQAHNGSIWTIKFSCDGRYLATAGEDRVIHVWKVVESEKKGELLTEKTDDANLNVLLLANGSPEPALLSPKTENYPEKKRRGRHSISRKSLSLDQIVVPETVFALTEKPFCSFQGHLDDVLDLSWSKSQHLLSSSMDKTVRLWNLSSKSCLKIFSHSDYVTCIQFNPADDRYFISGSLDAKVRIWSIPDRQVVDWNDLHEMVTAACYTPDGQGALVGTYKGSCRLYNTSDNKLQQKSEINLQNKKKKSHHKKITGFQFAPGSSSEVLITSADSRIRVINGVDLVHKFKGFRNTNSQISASVTANGKYVISASEDSNVYVWKHAAESRPRTKGVTDTRSYEHFHCKDVSVAIPWPGVGDSWGLQEDIHISDQNGGGDRNLDEVSTVNHPPTPAEDFGGSLSASGCSNSPLHGTISSATNSYFFDRISATWPEEKLVLAAAAARNKSPRTSVDFTSSLNPNMSAWGMVIVTAGLRGEIRTFQNFGLPVRI